MKLSFSVKSLTPIVTGDHDHRNKEILPTGLLGSLRYQYWLLKAMEAWEKAQKNSKPPVYPPLHLESLDKGNKYDLKSPDSDIFQEAMTEALKNAGPVIQLFGATGWKRMFKLEIANAATSSSPLPASARSGQAQPCNWTFNLIFRADRTSSIFDALDLDLETEINNLMSFVHHYGWLGAAPQNGFGWVEVTYKGEDVTETVLPKNNPVFACTEMNLTEDQITFLNTILTEMYTQKLTDARQRKKQLQRDGDKNKQLVKQEEIKIQRYTFSLDLLNHQSLSLGYEIKRWLRSQCLQFDAIYFGNNDDAGYLQVTHLVKQSGLESCYKLRLRCCSRPKTGKDSIYLLPENKQFDAFNMSRVSPQVVTNNMVRHIEKLRNKRKTG